MSQYLSRLNVITLGTAATVTVLPLRAQVKVFRCRQFYNQLADSLLHQSLMALWASVFADFTGLKIRTPHSAVFTDFFKTLDATPQIVNFGQLYALLQPGCYSKLKSAKSGRAITILENSLSEPVDP